MATLAVLQMLSALLFFSVHDSTASDLPGNYCPDEKKALEGYDMFTDEKEQEIDEYCLCLSQNVANFDLDEQSCSCNDHVNRWLSFQCFDFSAQGIPLRESLLCESDVLNSCIKEPEPTSATDSSGSSIEEYTCNDPGVTSNIASADCCVEQKKELIVCDGVYCSLNSEVSNGTELVKNYCQCLENAVTYFDSKLTECDCEFTVVRYGYFKCFDFTKPNPGITLNSSEFFCEPIRLDTCIDAPPTTTSMTTSTRSRYDYGYPGGEGHYSAAERNCPGSYSDELSCESKIPDWVAESFTKWLLEQQKKKGIKIPGLADNMTPDIPFKPDISDIYDKRRAALASNPVATKSNLVGFAGLIFLKLLY